MGCSKGSNINDREDNNNTNEEETSNENGVDEEGDDNNEEEDSNENGVDEEEDDNNEEEPTSNPTPEVRQPVIACTPSPLPDTERRIEYDNPCTADFSDIYSPVTECYLPEKRPIDIRIQGTLPAYDSKMGAYFFPVSQEDLSLQLSYSLAPDKEGNLYISNRDNSREELVEEGASLDVSGLDLSAQASCRVLRVAYRDGAEQKFALYLTGLAGGAVEFYRRDRIW